MKSKSAKALYVGKATSLRTRLNSYFSSSNKNDPKTEALVSNVVDIDYIECASPQQALILEAALIKEKKPKYNIALRDNKSYPYVLITKERFPRISITRPKGKTKDLIFGPYTASSSLKSALVLIREIFPYRSCRVMPKNACLFFHLKLCPAPCINAINISDYKSIIDSICKILKGERKKLVNTLKAKMKQASEKNDFEKAAALRDKLSAIDNLYKGKPKEHQLVSLKEILNLPRIPLHIEAVDISSLGGHDSVGSLIVFKDGAPNKNNYRRFLIRETKGQDDYAMIAEVVRRRYKRLIKEKKALPDLLVVDGGKGHVVKVKHTLDELNISFPVIGIAKQNEEIWFPHQNKPLTIPKSAPCLHLIQRVRDEAHRFAHTYQLVRRRKRYDRI